MLANKLMSALSGAEEKLYVDDVFSAYTYTGNGATQTINNGIDLAGKGGLVWSKTRSGTFPHALVDTLRGKNAFLSSSETSGNQDCTGDLANFNSNGITYNAPSYTNAFNRNGDTYVNYFFRKYPKFFDVVTYTGNGANRTIAHSLGQVPGMIIVKPTSSGGSWWVWHRSFANNEYINLNTTAAKVVGGALYWNNTAPTGSVFSLGTDGSVNGNGTSYVAYLFAHDTSADGIIQCGVYTGNSNSSGPTVGLGWEPQYVLVKGDDHVTDWWLWDSSRGLTNNGGNVGTDPSLFLNQASVEALSDDNQIRPLSTGFQLRGSGSETNSNGYKYIYLAIRRPNKPPTTGTEVYNHLTRTGTGAVGSTAAVGFAPDLAISQSIIVGRVPTWVDRLRGVKKWLCSDRASSEETQTTSGLSSFDMLGVSYTVDNTEQPFAWNNPGEDKHQRFFRRAPGFMDVVCYTGTGVSGTIPHNLKTIPQLIFIKKRTSAFNWAGAFALIPASGINAFSLNLPDAPAMNPYNFGVNLSSSSFNPHNIVDASITEAANVGGAQYVAYLFASLPGISKVGSYTGNGTSQTINCGFTTGARFILIKRTNSTGDWYVWDTARGIISANDPHLSLNTSVAEVTTDDSVDPDASGFIVNQVAATNINVSGGTYIFLAIA